MGQTLKNIDDSFQNFSKWATYSLAFEYMDNKQVRLHDIQDIAAKHGIKPSVIATRRAQWLQYKKKRAFDWIKYQAKVNS